MVTTRSNEPSPKAKVTPTKATAKAGAVGESQLAQRIAELPGSQTAFTIDMLYSKHMPRLNEQYVIDTAESLSVEPEALMAFGQIESPKGPYMADGRPYILYEAHVFSRNCSPKGKYDETHPTLSCAKWDPNLYGPGGSHQYDRLARALKLNQHAALCACSWGAYQILGENYKLLGFDTPEEMVLYMVESEANQFDCFIRFLKERGIINALRARDWDTAFFRYNGSGYKIHHYDTRFLSIYRDLKSYTLRRGRSGVKVIRLQQLLNKFDFGLKVDGVFGASTEAAVKDLQRRWGITVDGVVGAQTYERLASERVGTTSMLASKRNIGAGGLAAGGAAAVIKGINNSTPDKVAKAEDFLKQLQDIEVTAETAKKVVISAKDATQQVQEVQNQSSSSLVILGLFVIVIAGYIVWTKWFDKKKARGVN